MNAERFLMCGSVSSLRRIKNSVEEEAVVQPYNGLILFYKSNYLHPRTMVATRIPKVIIKDNASYVVIANTSQAGGTD